MVVEGGELEVSEPPQEEGKMKEYLRFDYFYCSL